jgi:hypothetical protein
LTLLELDSGNVSLEFDEAELDALKAAIADRFGGIRTIRKTALHDVVQFGGEEFTYYHEWDPCLISQSAEGARMLRTVQTEWTAQG